MKREHTVGFMVRSLSNLFRRSIDYEIEKIGNICPSGVQSWILGYLSDHNDHPVYQCELESKFEVRRSTMTEILNGMEKNGLIIRVRDHDDARKKQVQLTDEATAMHNRVIAAINCIENTANSGLSIKEIQEFLRISAKIKENLEKRLESKGE